jgi:hypothetical protein
LALPTLISLFCKKTPKETLAAIRSVQARLANLLCDIAKVSLESNQTLEERIKLGYCWSDETKTNQLQREIFSCLKEIQVIFPGWTIPANLQAEIQELLMVRRMQELGVGASQLRRDLKKEVVKKVAANTLHLVTRLHALMKATSDSLEDTIQRNLVESCYSNEMNRFAKQLDGMMLQLS